ncbi:MAG TPA: YezD family protein [Actinomycetota bacterium]|jgi:hypothetical protein
MSGDGRKEPRIPTEVRAFAGLDLEMQRLLLRVAEHLATIPYGTVEIVTQDGRVIQIATSEKIRLG